MKPLFLFLPRPTLLRAALGLLAAAALFAPGFGVLISWLAFGEVPRPIALAGGALMIPALLLFVRGDRTPPPSAVQGS